LRSAYTFDALARHSITMSEPAAAAATHQSIRLGADTSGTSLSRKDFTMNIAANSGVSAAVTAAQSSTAGAVQIRVLNKALDAQASTAAALIQSLPQQPALATSGKVGTHVNTHA
jgi:hypothetical protein